MARYIDADKLIAHLKDEIKGCCEPHYGKRINGKSVAYGTVLGLKSAISFAETLSSTDVAKEIFKKIKRELKEAIKNNYEVRREHIEKHGEILDEFDSHTYGKILALDGMLGFIEHLEEEYGIIDEEL